MFAELSDKHSWLHKCIHGGKKFVCERHINDNRGLTWLSPPSFNDFIGLVWT